MCLKGPRSRGEQVLRPSESQTWALVSNDEQGRGAAATRKGEGQGVSGAGRRSGTQPCSSLVTVGGVPHCELLSGPRIAR